MDVVAAGTLPRCVLTALVVCLWLAPATATGPVLHGNDTICNEGEWVELTCDGASVWMLNKSALAATSDNGEYVIDSVHGVHTLTIRCLSKFNNSNISCFNSLTVAQSNIILFLVQGLLGQVPSLEYVGENQTLSWKPPYQLNTSQTTMYDVVVAKVTDQSRDLVSEEHNRTETYLELYGRIERGSTYNVSLWALNAVGKGKETALMFTEEIATVTDDKDATDDKDGTGSSSSNSSTGRSRNLLNIVGGAVGGALLLTLVVVLVIAIVLIVRRKKCRPPICCSETDSPKTSSFRSVRKATLQHARPGVRQRR